MMDDVIVIGAGAAGLFCAMTAARRGRRVSVLEAGPKPGAKILISGGGRCNFTNLGTTAANFFSDNPHFAKSALARFTPRDFLALVEGAGIAWHEKTLGQLFCDGSARQIVDLLAGGATEAGARIETGCAIGQVERDADGFVLHTDRGPRRCARLVVATGGPSIPKLGASDFAWRLAARFGLPVVPARPALVPLTITDAAIAAAFGAGSAAELAGVSFDTIAGCGRTRFREAALITHRGLSGPAILQISTPWRPGAAITLDLLPGKDAPAMLREAKRRRPRASLGGVLGEHLPQRLAASLAALLPQATGRGMADLPDRALDGLATHLGACPVQPSGSEGFAKAEVSAGGVATSALSSKTMEARDIPGLYVIGEAVDVTGWLGGYNFQWAWSSGYCAGNNV